MKTDTKNKKFTVPTDEEVLEQEIVALEGRRTRAEGEYLVICADKKRLVAEMEQVTADIEAAKKVVQKNNEKIVEINDKILAVKGELRIEEQALATFITETNESKKTLEDTIASLTKRKNGISNDIADLEKKHSIAVKKCADELESLETKKVTGEAFVKTLEDKKASLTKSITDLNKDVEAITAEIEVLKAKVPPLENNITALGNTIETQRGTISNNKVIIQQHEDTKKEKLAEIAKIDKDIVKKTDEYKAIESQAFNLLKKEELLNNREAFIKAQYERAGVKWENI